MKWWTEPQNEAHASMIPLVEKLVEVQAYRTHENLKHARLYGNLDILGLRSDLVVRPGSSHNRITLNVVQSCVDTASAKIAKNRPRPTFLTDGGDWALQQKAKKLDRFVSGQFYEAKTYEETARCFIDGGVFGTGILKVFSEYGQVKNERVFPDEIIVDDAEALYGKPRAIYQHKAISRDVLKALYPGHDAAIDELQSIQGVVSIAQVDHADMVEVWEGWRLAPSPKSGGGRHAICIKGATLFDGAWTRPHFPFAVFRFNPRIAGFYGQGIAEQLVGIQVEINKILQNISRSAYLNSAPVWLVENSSKVISAHINNEIGHILKYTNIKPELATWSTYHPQEVQRLENLYQKAFEICGISQLSAQAQKPAGLDSKVALREFSDIESERFVQVGQRWEQFHLDIGELHIFEGREIWKQNKDYSVKTRSRQFIETIPWKDVNMSDDCFQMKCFPTSILPHTPSGKKQFVEELLQSGMIDPDTGLELMEMPDLTQETNLRFAARNVARDTVSKILEDGVFISPEPFDDLKYMLKYAQMSYNYARLHNCPEENLELLRRLMETCHAMGPDAGPVVDPSQNQAPDPSQEMGSGAGQGAPPALPTAPMMQAS